MITRTLRGMGAMAVVILGLLGWPAALLGIGSGAAPWLPDLADPHALLSRPDTGGLFLAIALALSWAAWVVWSVALAVEVSAQVRGVPTRRLGGLFPQGAAAALVTAIAVAFANTPSVALTTPATPFAGADMNSTATSSDSLSVPTAAGPIAASTGHADANDDSHDYTVRRGDTLWDIADEHLNDPTRYPEIAEASDEINQPDGRRLEDPDLILPGWTLYIPTPPSAAVDVEGSAEVGDERPPGVAQQVTPPATPMRPAGSVGADSQPCEGLTAPPRAPIAHTAATSGSRGAGAARGSSSAIPSAGSPLPSTPLRVEAPGSFAGTAAPMSGAYTDVERDQPGEDASAIGLPDWITAPLVPASQGSAEDLVASVVAQVEYRR